MRQTIFAFVTSINATIPPPTFSSSRELPARADEAQLTLFRTTAEHHPEAFLGALGRGFLSDLRRSGHVGIPTLPRGAFVKAMAADPVTPTECLAVAVAYLVQDDQRDPRTLQRLIDEMTRFVATLELHEIPTTSAVRADQVDSYLHGAALGPDGIHRRPSHSTISHRRTAVREFYALGRSLGFASGDPTLDLDIPARLPRATRPLTDDEILTVRAVADGQFESVRNPAIVALAESGAANAELAALRIVDIDLERRLLHLPGSRRTCPRANPIEDAAIEPLQRRLHVLRDAEPTRPVLVASGVADDVATASISNALRDLLRFAGHAGDPRVKPDSIRAGAARRLHERTGHIEDVVRFLGLRSLDAAASVIGYEWADRGSTTPIGTTAG